MRDTAVPPEPVGTCGAAVASFVICVDMFQKLHVNQLYLILQSHFLIRALICFKLGRLTKIT